MSASTSQPPDLNPEAARETTPLIINSDSTAGPIRVNPRKRTLWPWVILVTLVVIANGVVLFLLFEGVGMDTRQHFVDSYDPKSIIKHIGKFEEIGKNNGGSITLGKGFNASMEYIYSNIHKETSPCILYKQHFKVPIWELNQTPSFKKTKFQKVEFKINAEFVILPFGGKSTRIGSTRVLSLSSRDCTAEHYFGLKGRIAVIPHDPKCSLYSFALSAQEMGAVAVAFYAPEGQKDLTSNYTLLPQNWETGGELIHIPVLSISFGVMVSLLEDELNSQVSIDLDSILDISTSQNLICHVPGKDLDLEYGNPSSVLIIGGHLDSYQTENNREVNNISGASVLLETVNTIERSLFKPFNHLYFVWFGARSFNSLGTKHFVEKLEANEPNAFNRTLMFINVEELHNNIPQVYDGNTVQLPSLRNASQFLTNLMEEHFKEDNLKYELIPISQKTGQDSFAFSKKGIPVGGLTSGESKLTSLEPQTNLNYLNTTTLINCAESLITTIGALAIHEKLQDFFEPKNY